MHESRDGATAPGDGSLADRYRRYGHWKGWSAGAPGGAAAGASYAAELEGIPLGGRDVLEIGFGRGDFLAWARGQGARVVGLERDGSLVDRAREAGFDAYLADIVDAPALNGRAFDLIVAIDVLEHVPVETILGWFDRLPALLRPGGHFLARFPNGQSPLGRVFQHGDITHVTTLSPGIARQLAAIAGLELARVGNSHRPRADRAAWRLVQWARDRMRDGAEIAFARLYGIERIPLDPNVTVVWRMPP